MNEGVTLDSFSLLFGLFLLHSSQRSVGNCERSSMSRRSQRSWGFYCWSIRLRGKQYYGALDIGEKILAPST